MGGSVVLVDLCQGVGWLINMAGEVVAEINRASCLGFINRGEVRIMYRLAEKKVWVRVAGS